MREISTPLQDVPRTQHHQLQMEPEPAQQPSHTASGAVHTQDKILSTEPSRLGRRETFQSIGRWGHERDDVNCRRRIILRQVRSIEPTLQAEDKALLH